jgi:UDP-N-acetylmuramoyl-tripeptide--D-alanyl-D-alanine ligase
MQDYRIENPLADLQAFGKGKLNALSYAAYKITLDGTLFSFITTKSRITSRIDLHFPSLLLPVEYREVFGAAILAGLAAKLTLPQIKESLERNYEIPKGRAGIFKGVNNSVIIDSSYNASPAAVNAFLDMVSLIKKETKRPVVFLYGDMRELGNAAAEEHKKIAKRLHTGIQYLYLVGPMTREYVLPEVKAHSKAKEIEWFPHSKEAGKYIKKNMPKNAIILVKGSQNTIYLEEAIKEFLENRGDSQNLCRQEEAWLKVKGIS